MKLLHIVNIVDFPEGSSHQLAQSITLESLRRAKHYASQQGIELRIVSAQFPEDRKVLPNWIEATRNLEVSSLDHPEFRDKRKLPLISEIIERGIESLKEEEALIYSNIDIAVQPYFYARVAQKLEQEIKALSITRRTIPENLNSLEEMYAQLGKNHPGDDCFVFSRGCLDRLNLKPLFVGAAWFDKSLLLNCAAFCQTFEKIRDEQLTFHLGDDRSWVSKEALAIGRYNNARFKELILEVEAEQGVCPENCQVWPHISSVYEMVMKVSVKQKPESLFEKAKRKIKKVLPLSK